MSFLKIFNIVTVGKVGASLLCGHISINFFLQYMFLMAMIFLFTVTVATSIPAQLQHSQQVCVDVS